MKRKDFKKRRIIRNRRGYWEKGGGSETELLVAVLALGFMCVLVGAAIISSLLR